MPENSAKDSSHFEPSALVGVGASAGGLEALELFFRMVPLDTGMAFVVLQHLSPDFESRMDELLGRRTSLPIQEVRDGLAPRPNTIYLAPARCEMILSDGRFVLAERDPDKGFTLPIDNFLRSMANDLGDRAVGIILSGTGSDGSRGVREISEAGGLVLAQLPESAAFDGMPRSAIDTGCVHSVGAPQDLPRLLLELVGKRDRVEAPNLIEDPPRTGMDRLFELIRQAHGLDFTHYKSNTVIRRVGRRIALSSAKSVEEYADNLQGDPAELDALYRDLLIGVTRFFRDPEAFETLEREIIGDLVKQCGPDRELRVWVPGCATGEEAYSLAILIDEAMVARNHKVPVKIFATDVHAHSLDVASTGCYPFDSLAEMTEERRQRYFSEESDGTYRVSQDLRQMVVFARQNVLNNAPFTRIDLISCRNLLIYFESSAQKKVLSLFHFALRSSGILFLGPSEAPGQLSDEFQTIHTHWKIYRKRRDIRLPIESRLPLTSRTAFPTPTTLQLASPSPPSRDQRLLGVYDRLLEQYMPAGVLVDDRYELLHTFGNVDKLVRLPKGRASTRLLDLLHPSIRTAVSGALHRATKTKQPLRYTGLVAIEGEQASRYSLSVQPISNPRMQTVDFFLAFDEVAELDNGPASGPMDDGELSRDYVGSLEAELRFAQENLQATIEELETSNEELQASNEELVASNEELQSTNEELHSVNEELHSVNSEHQEQIEELRELTADIDNLLQSIEVGVIFLDPELRIRKFTQSVATSFRLLPQDVGRRLEDFSHNIDHAGLVDDLRAVLSGGGAIEREVTNKAGDVLLLRVLPYKSGHEICGVVLTLIDISTLKRSEADVRHLSAIVASSGDAIVARDLAGNITSWNASAERLFGYAAEEVIGKPDSIIVPDDQRKQMDAMLRGAAQGESSDGVETVRRHKDGSLIDVSVSVSPVRDERGRIFAISSISRDISRRKRAERSVKQSIKQRDHFLALLSHELRNPLMGLLTATALLENPDTDDGQRPAALAALRRQTNHMARLLDDLLDVSRVKGNNIDLRKSHIDLRETIDGALDSARPVAESANVVLETEITDEPIRTYADPARIQQLIVNLLTNAIKFTPSGKVVNLSMRKDGDDAVIEVHDQGIGIRSELLNEIFEPFHQGDEPLRETRSSMGLGLTLVQSIAKGHGGTVEVSSPGPAKGSSFTVRMPITEGRIAVSQPRADSVGANNLSRRILLVEDQEDNRELLSLALAAQGYDVITADCGARALQLLRENDLLAAIVDIGLPDMTGLDVAKSARKMHEDHAGLQTRRLALIALTGHGQTRDREAVLAAGFDEHLVKPVSLSVLKEAVTRVSGRH